MLLEIYGPYTALVYGRVRRYCEMQEGICRASRQSIADWLGISVSSVRRSLAVLVEDGYLFDRTPELKNKPHIYEYTYKLEDESDEWLENRRAEKAQSLVPIRLLAERASKEFEAEVAIENKLSVQSDVLVGSQRTAHIPQWDREDTNKETFNRQEELRSEESKTKSVFCPPHNDSALSHNIKSKEPSGEVISPAIKAEGSTDGISRHDRNKKLNEAEFNHGFKTKGPESLNQNIMLKKFGLSEFPSYAMKLEFVQQENQHGEALFEDIILRAYLGVRTIEEAMNNLGEAAEYYSKKK